MHNVTYPCEVNGKLVTGNGSLIPISSLSNRSLLPSSTVLCNTYSFIFHCTEKVEANLIPVDSLRQKYRILKLTPLCMESDWYLKVAFVSLSTPLSKLSLQLFSLWYRQLSTVQTAKDVKFRAGNTLKYWYLKKKTNQPKLY